jgi:Contractile injection system tube protein
MTTKARGPLVFKGALVSISPTNPKPHVISFQYNPATLKRSLKPLMVGGEAGDRSQSVRITGAPTETYSVEIEIDASDDLEAGDAVATSLGIQPQLAVLELLIYPTLSRVKENAVLLKAGTIEIAPITAPRVLFVWGKRRVLPVQLSSYSISEEEFDTSLNPIRATVSLEMRVLTYSDLSESNPDYQQYIAYQESLMSTANSARAAGPDALNGVTIVS